MFVKVLFREVSIQQTLGINQFSEMKRSIRNGLKSIRQALMARFYNSEAKMPLISLNEETTADISVLWKNYNTSANLLKSRLGRTSNLVGEYAEYLIKEYLNGEILAASSASADIVAPDGDLYQVKSRKISFGQTTQLGIIRSWDFDYLAVVLFDDNGSVLKGLIYPKLVAQKYAVQNDHQNGLVITTTNEFFNELNKLDITRELREINDDLPIDILREKTRFPKFEHPIIVQSEGNKLNEVTSEMKIGQYVRQTFNEIIPKIDRRELENLQRQDYSKAVFDLQFPFLRKVSKSDHQKPLRYWKEPVEIFGELYFMCSEWYEKDPNNDRPYYEKWLKKMRSK